MENLTIGIEEEYQIIDPESRALSPFIAEMMDKGAVLFQDQVKPEFMQSQIEVGSQVCRNVKEARQEIRRLRSIVAETAEKSGQRIVAAGTHPFSHWQDQLVTDRDRYKGLMNDLQQVGRQLVIFGMHIHIGIEDPDLRIDVMNQLRYFTPHLFALSTSSPFWLGQDTGLKSYRSVVFEDLPRTGLPPHFESYSEYARFANVLIKTNCITDPSRIWWDIRPHPIFPTLEMRFCDCTTKVDEVIAIAALVQALVAKLIQLRRNNQRWRIYRSQLIEENKWRARKNGISGKLIDFGKQEEVPIRFLIEELLELVDDVVDPLGSREELEYIRKMLINGTSADRQLKKFRETGDLKDVVDLLIEETVQGL